MEVRDRGEGLVCKQKCTAMKGPLFPDPESRFA